MNKYIITLALILFCNNAISKQWILVTTYQPKTEKGYSCSNYEHEVKESDDLEELKAARKALFDRKDIANINPTIIDPKSFGILYQYQRVDIVAKCEMNAVRVMTGSNVNDARKKMQMHVKDYPKNIASEPQEVAYWPNRKLGNTRRMFEGVEIIFVTGSNESLKSPMIAKLHNINENNSAHVVFKVNGEVKEIFLNPQDKGTLNLSSDLKTLEVIVELGEIIPNGKEFSVVQEMREVTREYLIAEGIVNLDQKKGSDTVWGSRQ